MEKKIFHASILEMPYLHDDISDTRDVHPGLITNWFIFCLLYENITYSILKNHWFTEEGIWVGHYMHTAQYREDIKLFNSFQGFP